MKTFATFRRVGLFALAALLLCSEFASAQDYRGKVQGTVTDPSQAAVAQANVTLRNINTGIETVRTTDGEGHYLFDFVIPGTYSVSVASTGFQKYVQENVSVLTRGDVTVNAVLSVGAVTSNVEVNAAVTAVEFNTSTMTTTIQGNLVQDLPVLARNPFTLALLNPAVVNQYWDIAHRNPFYMWSNGGMNIGGPTGGKNDQEMDGTTLNISARGSYNAPMDTVQEVSVAQNAMDAEFGFSAGGTVNLATKSGTNDYHGSAYYLGRNPAFDALANRVTRDAGVVRSNIWGFSVGNPVIKNKLFNFFNYEKWNVKQPSVTTSTVPTAAEKNGDFSAALTPGGAQQMIYDPTTTIFNATTSTATRTAFAGNKIPTYRMDPAGVMAVGNMWAPNNAGTDLSGLNNFQKSYPWWENYWNLNDRADYNINEKWRLFSRFSKFQTRLDNPNWGGTIAVPSANGGIMDAMNAMADILYMAGPRTTVNIRMGVSYMEDDYASEWAQQPTSLWASFWPNNNFYTKILNPLQGIYYPNFNFDGNGHATAGVGNWWLVHGRSYNPTINVSHDVGKHHIKTGWQMRYSYDQDNASSGPGGFSFMSVDTGSSFLGYDPTKSGNMYASALLGVLNGGPNVTGGSTYNNQATIAPNLDMRQQQWGLFFQDDIKVNRNITLNLGMRWERETAPAEQTRQLVKTLDLTVPISQLQNTVMPSQVTNIAKINYLYNGSMVFTSNSNPRMYDAPWNTWLPRAGIAYRVNDKTSVRAGYSRYAVPWVTVHAETGGLPTYGYSQSTSILNPLQGVPRAYLSNPFPSTNPIVLPSGNSLGGNTYLGNSVSFWNGNAMKTPLNDRLNFSVQHQAMEHLFAEATFFIHYGHNVQDGSMWGGSNGYNLNAVNPALSYQFKGLLDQTVTNPFYGLSASIMPGSLANQPTVTVSQLLRQYPQYGDLTQLGWPGGRDHYYGLALKAERPLTKGIGFMFGYNYNQETHTQYATPLDQYTNTYTMLDRERPRHNFSIAGTWEVPVGRGRTYLGNANKIVDGIIGGWVTSQIFMAHSGNLLNFNQAAVTGDPRQNVPSGSYFNPAVFAVSPAYTPRTNPWYYDGLRGPSFWQLDSTAAKYFPITEKIKLEIRFELFNMPNIYMPGDPDTTIGSGTMGRSTGPADGNYGREVQYSAKIHF